MGGGTTVDEGLDVDAALRGFRRELSRDLDVERVILFGSQATGEAGEYSDVDLLVVSRDFEGMDHFERGAKMYDYWDSLLPVDFLCYTPNEFRELRSQVSIVRKAMDTGKPVEA